MKVTVLGSGNAFHADGRGSSGVRVDLADGAFLVDCGPTVPGRLMAGPPPPTLPGRLFVTHLHGDHVAGWPFLLLAAQHGAARREGLEVWGPTGVRGTLEGLARLCYGELLEPPRAPWGARFRELDRTRARGLRAGEIAVETVPMEHHPTSIGYRFEADGRSLAVSGDTRWCAGVEELAAGVDLLLLECTTVREPAEGHLSLGGLRARFSRIDARRIVLVHIDDEVAAALAADPLPRTVAGYDGLEIELD